jgi:hypothetical protein
MKMPSMKEFLAVADETACSNESQAAHYVLLKNGNAP